MIRKKGYELNSRSTRRGLIEYQQPHTKEWNNNLSLGSFAGSCRFQEAPGAWRKVDWGTTYQPRLATDSRIFFHCICHDSWKLELRIRPLSFIIPPYRDRICRYAVMTHLYPRSLRWLRTGELGEIFEFLFRQWTWSEGTYPFSVATLSTLWSISKPLKIRRK